MAALATLRPTAPLGPHACSSAARGQQPQPQLPATNPAGTSGRPASTHSTARGGSSAPPHFPHLMPVARSYFSNSSRSVWLQLRPMGEMLIMPLRNSMKVPRLTGMSMSAHRERGGRRWAGSNRVWRCRTWRQLAANCPNPISLIQLLAASAPCVGQSLLLLATLLTQTAACAPGQWSTLAANAQLPCAKASSPCHTQASTLPPPPPCCSPPPSTHLPGT